MVVEMFFVVGNNNKSIRSGDTLHGALQMQIDSSSNEGGASLDQLEVYFEGVEYASMPKINRLTQGLDNLVKKHCIVLLDIRPGKVTCISQQQRSMDHWSDRESSALLPMGNYEVKFSIPLPPNLPSSTVITHDGGIAKIEYSIKAVLRGSTKEDGDDDCYHACEVVQVNAPIQTTKSKGPVPMTRVKPCCHGVRGSFLMKRGQVYTGAQSENALLLTPGEKLQIDLAVINEGRIPIENINVVLRERVRWSALKRNSKTITTNLVSLSLNADLLPDGDKTEIEWMLEKVKDHNPKERNLFLIKELLGAGGHDVLSITLPPLPEEARNTYIGSPCVTITHEAIITLVLSKKWKKCSYQPQVRVPVRIVGSQCQPTTFNKNESSFREWCKLRKSFLAPEDSLNASFKRISSSMKKSLNPTNLNGSFKFNDSSRRSHRIRNNDSSHRSRNNNNNNNNNGNNYSNDDDNNNNKLDDPTDCNTSCMLGASTSTFDVDTSFLAGLNPAHESLRTSQASQRLVF